MSARASRRLKNDPLINVDLLVLQIDQAPTLTSLLLTLTLPPERIRLSSTADRPGLRRVLLLWHARELTVHERIRACTRSFQLVETLAGAVDERAGSGVLCRNTRVSDVSERVLTVSA